MTSLLKLTSPRTTSSNSEGLVVGHTQSNGRGLATLDSPSRLFARDVPAPADVLWRLALSQGGMPIHLELLGRAETVVRLVMCEQFDRVRPVDMGALGLPVRPPVAAFLDALVPVEPEPPEILDDAALRLRGRPLGVRVLDAQDEGAPISPGEQPVEERRAGIADVQVTGGTGSETNSHDVYRKSKVKSQKSKVPIDL